MNKDFEIFKAFFKMGLILLGGGYVILPIAKRELVEKRNWLTEDELLDYYCVCGSLPGIIAINTAILTGYKLAKIKGALISVFAMSLSPFIAIILVAEFLDKIMNISFIQGLFWGVNISVIVLIYLTVKEMWQKSILDKKTLFWFLLILFLSFHKASPAALVVFSILAGISLELIEGQNE